MAVIVVMMVIVVMTVVVMMVMVVAGIQKLRFDLQDTIEVERPALQYVRQRNLAAFGAVQFGIGVDGPNPRFDFGEFSLGNQIDLVEHDDISERDLVLGF